MVHSKGHSSFFLAALLVVVAISPVLHAQMTHRLKGAIRTEAGAPLEMALLVQQASLAKTISGMVLQADPKHPRALVGAASAALLGRDWETAGEVLWTARDLAPREQRQALAAAIGDLQGISRVQ